MPEPCSPRKNTKVPIISADEPSHPVFGLEEDLTGDGPWLQTEDLVQLEDLKPSLPPNVLHDLRLYMEERRMQHEDVNRKDIITFDNSTACPRKRQCVQSSLPTPASRPEVYPRMGSFHDGFHAPSNGLASPTLSVDSAIAELSSSDCSSDTWSDIEVPMSTKCHFQDSPTLTKHWKVERNGTKKTCSPARVSDPPPQPTVCFLKRPKNGFIRYAMKHRRQVSAENPQLDNREISRILGMQWRHLSPGQKAEFELEFQAEMEARKQQFPNWNYGARRGLCQPSPWEPIPSRLRPRDKLKRKFLPRDIPRLSRPYVRRRSRPVPSVTPACDNWVQCDRCNKWRRLPPYHRPDYLPDMWFCEYNSIPYNSCTVPEESAEHDIDVAYHDHSYPTPLPHIGADSGAEYVEMPGWDLDELLGFSQSWDSLDACAAAMKTESLDTGTHWDNLDTHGAAGQWDMTSMDGDLSSYRPRPDQASDPLMISGDHWLDMVWRPNWVKSEEPSIKTEETSLTLEETQTTLKSRTMEETLDVMEDPKHLEMEASVEEPRNSSSNLQVARGQPQILGKLHIMEQPRALTDPQILKEGSSEHPFSTDSGLREENPAGRPNLVEEDFADVEQSINLNAGINSLNGHQRLGIHPTQSDTNSCNLHQRLLLQPVQSSPNPAHHPPSVHEDFSDLARFNLPKSTPSSVNMIMNQSTSPQPIPSSSTTVHQSGADNSGSYLQQTGRMITMDALQGYCQTGQTGQQYVVQIPQSSLALASVQCGQAIAQPALRHS